MTPLAERYGATAGSGGVSDIFLPDALARTIPAWSSDSVLVPLRSISAPSRSPAVASGLLGRRRR